MTRVKQICVSIDPEALAFCKTARFSPSRILRKAINDLRTRKEDRIDFELANKRLLQKLERVMSVLEGNLSKQQFEDLLKKM